MYFVIYALVVIILINYYFHTKQNNYLIYIYMNVFIHVKEKKWKMIKK
jgi:hypothetical protein